MHDFYCGEVEVERTTLKHLGMSFCSEVGKYLTLLLAVLFPSG